MKLHIEKAIYGGAGLARSDGKAIFVPMTLPGETVEVAMKRDKGSFAEAELLEVLETSPARVPAPCPYYGACGGCQYQHATYEEQLAMKRGILLETLGRAGLRDVPEVTIHAGEPWGYRNRIRLHVDAATHALGYRRRGSNSLLPVDTCPIAAPLLQQTLGVLRQMFPQQQAGTWCAEVELCTNHDSSALLLSFHQRPGTSAKARPDARLREEDKALERLCSAVQAQVPQLRGAGLFHAAAAREAGDIRPVRASRPARAAHQEKRVLADDPDGEGAAGSLMASWGERAVQYRVRSQSYHVSLGAFFQGNRFLVESLVNLATSGAGGKLAWDLFAGVGLFARALATHFEEVVAVEGAPISAADLRINLANLPNNKANPRGNPPTHRIVESSTLAFLSREGETRKAPGKRPEKIVLDPPRAGLGMEASTLLASIRSPHITYVSCDPATLSRDVRVLVDAGYIISQLHLVDMFPQTFHLETVAMLELR